MAKNKIKGGEKGKPAGKPATKPKNQASDAGTTTNKTTPFDIDTSILNGIANNMVNGGSDGSGGSVGGAGYPGLYPGVGTNGEDLLANILSGLKVNNLDAYVTDQLRNDFIRDENYIRGALNNATNASYDVQRAQALRDAANAENTNLANTRNAIAEMRRNLIGSASSGANVGAANATALQALLGLGQQNTQVTTEGLQNVNNVERERAATLAQNAVDAINTANSATNDMYGAATSAYGSDRSYAAQGAAEAIGNIKSSDITNQSQERMNTATNEANLAAAKLAADANVKSAKITGKYNVKSAKAAAKGKN